MPAACCYSCSPTRLKQQREPADASAQSATVGSRAASSFLRTVRISQHIALGAQLPAEPTSTPKWRMSWFRHMRRLPPQHRMRLLCTEKRAWLPAGDSARTARIRTDYRSIFSSRYATKLESRKRCRQAWATGLDTASNSIQAQSTENIESTF